MNITSQECC